MKRSGTLTTKSETPQTFHNSPQDIINIILIHKNFLPSVVKPRTLHDPPQHMILI